MNFQQVVKGGESKFYCFHCVLTATSVRSVVALRSHRNVNPILSASRDIGRLCSIESSGNQHHSIPLSMKRKCLPQNKCLVTEKLVTTNLIELLIKEKKSPCLEYFASVSLVKSDVGG